MDSQATPRSPIDDHAPPSESWGPAAAVEREEIEALLNTLRRLRSRARFMLVAGRLLLVLAAALAIATGAGLLDFAMRLPTSLRVILWVIGVGVLARELWVAISPAWRFAPSLTDLALRIERRVPELRGVLASAVDFASSAHDHEQPARSVGVESPLGRALSSRVVHRAIEAWRSTDHSGIFRARRVAGRAGWFAAACAVCVGLLAASPALWAIGAQRVLVPWSGAAWPKRTGVIDATTHEVHPLGAALPLQAVLTQSNRAWDLTYVAVRYRQVAPGGRAGAERRELLTYQNREITLEGDLAVRGALFERLIEPSGYAIQYRFETEDDQTDWRTIRLIEPPAVVSAEAVITPPEYAHALGAASAEEAAASAPAALALGPGTDDRALAPPALAGSSVKLTITLNRELPIPESVRSIFQTPDDEEGAGSEPTLTSEGATWSITWTLDESLRLPITLRDEHGIESVEQAVYRFEALSDRPAAATITEPPADRSALATASLNVVGEGRDDVGLAWVRVQRQIAKPAGAPGRERSGPGGAVEPIEEPVELAMFEVGGAGQGRASVAVDLAELNLQPGDEVRFMALALDLLGASTGAAPTLSPVRTIRIISEAQLVAEVQGALSDIRQAAIRIEEQQSRLLERTEAGIGDSQSRRGQAQVTERLARQEEAVQRLRERIEENGLADQALRDLLSRATSSLESAGAASARASQALDQAAEQPRGGRRGQVSPEGAQAQQPSEASSGRAPGQQPEGAEGQAGESGASQPSEGSPQAGGAQPSQQEQGQASQPAPGEEAEASPEEEPVNPDAPQLTEEQQQEVADAQRTAQDEMRALIELLDRGEDAWVVRNSLERLVREQRELREQTQATGQRTAGRDVDQLSPQERSEIEAIAERQNRLAEETRRLMEDMKQRQEKLREQDPASAQGMAQASRRAQSEQVEQTMRGAASDASQNQTASASRQQQQAEQSLEEMLEDLNAGDRARDETLRRALASIIESLDSLIVQQEGELALLDEVIRERKAYTGLDARMIRLNQNTIGVFDFIKQQGSDLAPIANLVGRASEAQSAAIRDLRNLVVVSKSVRANEQRSLDLLRQAREKAGEIDDQIQERQRRKKVAELKKQYRELLEQQVAIRAETEPLAALPELSRRDRVLARGLAERQDIIRDRLAAMLRETAELADAIVFEFAHRRLDERAGRASSALRDARLVDALSAERLTEAALRSIIESLNDPPPEEQKFSEAEGGGGGGGGGGGSQQALIPPAKELILLKGMQIGLSERTFELHQLGATAPRAEVEALGREQRELMNVGVRFMEKLEKQQQQGAGATPVAPVPEPPQGEGE